MSSKLSCPEGRSALLRCFYSPRAVHLKNEILERTALSTVGTVGEKVLVFCEFLELGI